MALRVQRRNNLPAAAVGANTCLMLSSHSMADGSIDDTDNSIKTHTNTHDSLLTALDACRAKSVFVIAHTTWQSRTMATYARTLARVAQFAQLGTTTQCVFDVHLNDGIIGRLAPSIFDFYGLDAVGPLNNENTESNYVYIVGIVYIYNVHVFCLEDFGLG